MNVSAELHKQTGTLQHVTSFYCPQLNGIVEQQNCIMKDTFIKSPEDRGNWIERLPAVLFAYLTAKHSAKQISLRFKFYLTGKLHFHVEFQHNPATKDR